MTKTLTEQWREGKLPEGYYYIRVKEQGKEKIIEHKISGSAFFYDQNVVLGIVAPVPSYDEYKKLKEQLEIATKALKEINEKYRFTVAQEVVYKALEEINEVGK